MSVVAEKAYGGLQRPFTKGTFQEKLDKFGELIDAMTYQEEEITPEERRQKITENLRYDQFCEKIRALFGSEIKNQDLKAIYKKISTNPDAKVDWSELFGYFQSGPEEEDITVGEEVSVFTVGKRKRVGEAAGDRRRRDIVQSIKYIPSLDSYLTASQKGAISVWNSKLRLNGCVDINEASWVTGCDYIPNLRRVICCSERSITIWDNRASSQNQSLLSIKPIEDPPQCICHVSGRGLLHEDMVLYGDDQGYVNVLTLAANDLNMKNFKGENKNSQKFIIDSSKLTHPICKRKVHDDWVVNVKYFPDLRCFASCSPSSKKSFVLEEIDRLYDNGEIRGVSIPKGVNAFDYCVRANIIATGGVDKVIRVWHPHIFSRPTGKLIGHLFTIVDICCNERDQHIISLSTARVFRVWDIHTLSSLQIFTDNEERPGERRIYSMTYDQRHERLLTGSSVVDAWPLTRSVQDNMQVPHTHDRSISQLLYNKELNQVITVCTESTMKVWEMDTGKLVYQLPEAHGPNIEVTAIALDRSGYRLASGAYDGSIKIWDFGAGQEIKCKLGRKSDEDLSITGLVYFKRDDDRVVLATGWNNKIRLLLDSTDNYDLPVMRDFSDVYYWPASVPASPNNSPFGKCKPLPSIEMASPEKRTSCPPGIGMASPEKRTDCFRKEFILTSHDVHCIDSSLPDRLVTGCLNGNVVIWNIGTALIDKVLQLPSTTENEAQLNEHRVKHSNERRVNMVKILHHKVRKLDPAYIKKLTRHVSDHSSNSSSTNRTSSKTNETEIPRTSSKTNETEIPRTSSKTNETEIPRTSSKTNETENPSSEVDDSKTISVESDSSKSSIEVNVNDDAPRESVTDSNEDGENSVVSATGEKPGVGDDNEDPEINMIVEDYPPIIVSAHQDACLRFWSMEGVLLREISSINKREGSAITAVCHDNDCNILITGDSKGYLTMWDIAKFLEKPDSPDQENVTQIIIWRGHLTKIVSLAYVDSMKVILSGSTDESIRVWWGTKGRFVGFFNQHRHFSFPHTDDSSVNSVLPYDITESPQLPQKAKSGKQKIHTIQRKYEYPLIFDNERWRPFRRSAYTTNKRPQPEDKKFFDALIKPRAYNHHLESFTTGEKRQGAVFRALPVYRIITPKRLRTPHINYSSTREDSGYYNSSFLYGNNGPSKGARAAGRMRDDKSLGVTRSYSPHKTRRNIYQRTPVLAFSSPNMNPSAVSSTTLSPMPGRR